jgi:hypothetical protein
MTVKGKWKKWREENLREVSEETERLYRRLADAVAQDENFFVKCKSIRAAMKHLAKYEDKDGKLVLKPERPRQQRSRSGNDVTGLTPPETDTPSTGLEAELENAAADEIIGSIDADKLEEVAKASIAKLTPDKVCVTLVDGWHDDGVKLNQLVKLINEHLDKKRLRAPITGTVTNPVATKPAETMRQRV